uniref:Si:dkey-85k7.12 n=2 Tax=Salmo trutta TaxID=8032 RepID=A0A673W7P8_SALTR
MTGVGVRRLKTPCQWTVLQMKRHFLKMKCLRCHTLCEEGQTFCLRCNAVVEGERDPGSLKDVAVDRGRSRTAEDTPLPMDCSSDEEEFHDASDQFFDFYLGEDEDTSQRVQANDLEPEPAKQMDAAVAEPVPPEKIKIDYVSSESVSLSWDKRVGVPEACLMTCSCDGKEVQKKTTVFNTLTFSSLSPGVKYSFHVCTVLKNGTKSKSAVTYARTKLSSPGEITVHYVGSDSISLSWLPSDPAWRYELTYSCHTQREIQSIQVSNSADVKGLYPGTEYTFSVTSVTEDGNRSAAVTMSVYTKPVPPEKIKIDHVSSESVSLSWDKRVGVPEACLVTCSCDGKEVQKKTTVFNMLTFSSLRPGVKYSFHVCTVLKNGTKSKSAVTYARTKLSSPGEIKVHYVGSDSISLSWLPSDPAWRYELTYSCHTQREIQSIQVSNSADVKGLYPGTEYTFSVTSVTEDGNWSAVVTMSMYTKPLPPEKIKIDHVSSESVSLSWDKRVGVPEACLVTCSCDGKEVQKKTTLFNTLTFSSLRPGVKYSFHVCTVLKNGTQSKSAVTYARTKTHLESLLLDLGLEQHYTEKLTLSNVLQIDKKTVDDEPAQTHSALPWTFLKRLMMVNVTARSGKCTSSGGEESCDADLDVESLFNNLDSSNVVNPLDVVTALFLCSNGFLQQEMTLKMSMCQFSVPLLLPNCDTEKCTLMLWAMRDIVKKFRPHSLADPRGFVEDRIVLSDLPMVSFVRLGKCSLSKSQILNKLLSNPQQYHDTFVHHDMECGDGPRRISNGLVEISWYLPSGKKNIDIFGEAVAVTNLRGDISSFETQYSFLCQTSAAVFVFFDNLDNKYKLLNSQHTKAQLFLVGNPQSKSFSIDALKKTAAELNLKKSNIILKTKQMNDADFVKNLRNTVGQVIKSSKSRMPLEQMAEVAHELGILVDEDCQECQSAKQKADGITSNIHDTPQYKERQLPLQGQIWKELARLEKEECRLRKAGNQNLEMYKSELQTEKRQLREQQRLYDMSEAMTCFIHGISGTGLERSYFLKWMRMNLDNMARKNLSGLRDLYKEKSQNWSENQDEIAYLDRQISNSSLGTEHFLREMGQLYESAVLLSETEESRQQLQHLPRLCAELLLDGFPLELVDGDASNIPLRWVSDVLHQLNVLVKPKNKILVVTVLGVQSTGKSTLLNTMFGVQFAVSSGRCTRGAFMLLIKVKEDFKKELNCDFLVIIDTEGLKSPELAQLDDSYEHDNELATFVVGLSDVTIINIAMENSIEMKDILQIVVHAFLRMKEVGKKPRCQFVHQNVADVSAHDKNMRDRKMLLEQLNEMTQAAARMENKEENMSFTDVMEYNPEAGNWYIPGLWHGNPPMAPVNAGYSESVYEFKKNMIKVFQNCEASGNNIMDFLEWTKSLWNAVKYENFIFSFRNSLVADAYMKLCIEFNKWEWSVRKHMHTWMTSAETRISNFGTIAMKSQTGDVRDFLCQLKSAASTELIKWEKTILDNLTKYYEQTEGHVYLVERYREDFANSTKSMKREMENSIMSKLEAAVEIRQGMNKLDGIKKKHTAVMEEKVLKLLEDCRKSHSERSEKDLDREFEKVWEETVQELSFTGLKKRDIVSDVFNQLRSNMKQKGGSVNEKLNKEKLEDHGKEPLIVTPEGVFKRLIKGIYMDEHTRKTQAMADNLIEICKQFVNEKIQNKTDYNDTYIQEIIHMIEEKLNANRNLGTSDTFEVSIKLYICGFASRAFQSMHEQFICDNNPRLCLEQFKGKYLANFKDLFNGQDQCRKKSVEFTNLCLKPAVEVYVASSLGPEIVDEMLTGQNAFQFSSRTFFQYSILKQLLSEFNFANYVSYTCHYEAFVKNWILGEMLKRFSQGKKMFELEDCQLKGIIRVITEAITKVQTNKNSNIKELIQDICRELGEKLVIPQDALEATMILNNSNQEQFSYWLKTSVVEMEQSLREEFRNATDVSKKLEQMRIKPQNILFTRVFGCGKQCPFCKSPCEAGGEAHNDHCASIHRPQGLGQYRFDGSKELVTDICSSSVFSESSFRCYETNGKYHPFKKYRDIFPNWHIPADPSIQASDYWKYVMAKFNKEFSKEYDACPGDIPPAWKLITKEQAEKSLRESFSITNALSPTVSPAHFSASNPF